MKEGFSPKSPESENLQEREDQKEETSEVLTKPPVGWESRHGLTMKLSRSKSTITKEAEKYRADHPEWFKRYISNKGYPGEHYSPELSGILEKRFPDLEEPPEGWMLNTAVAKMLDRDGGTIIKLVAPIIKEKPELSETYLDDAGREAVFYSPELIEQIKRKLKDLDVIDGWSTGANIGKEIGLDREAVIRRAERYRKDHPEWFRKMMTKGGIIEHLSPELTEILKKDYEGIRTMPDNWLTAKTISRIEGMFSAPTIRTFVEKFRDEHPGWFQKDEVNDDIAYEYYAPELIELIKTEFLKYPRRKDGWFANGALSKKINKAGYIIKEIADGYRKDHPEWFEMQRVMSGVYEHYSPELVKIIESITSGEKVPDGWASRFALARELDVNFRKLEKFANGYRTDNPGWFVFYVSKRGQREEHYSPELVKIVKEYYEGVDDDSKKRIKQEWTGRKDSKERRRKYKVENMPETFIDPDKHELWISIEQITKNGQLVGNITSRLGNVSKIDLIDSLGITKVFYSNSGVEEKIRDLKEAQELPRAGEDDAYIDPSGTIWVTEAYFFKKFDIPHIMIEKTLEDAPQITGLTSGGRKVRLYEHEESQETLEEAINLYKLPQLDEKTGLYTDPQGIVWMPISAVSEKFYTTKPALKKLAGVSTMDGRSRVGTKITLYNTQEIENKIGIIPEDWITRGQTQKELEIRDHWLEKIIAPVRKEHPEWFKGRKTTKGKIVREYFHPEVKRIIKEEIAKFKKWTSANSVSEELAKEGVDISPATVKNFADTLRTEHPDWFLVGSEGGIGASKELYSNQLVEKILENFREYPPPPEGWRTIGSLMNDSSTNGKSFLSLNYTTIKAVFEQYADESPDQIKKYRDITGVHTYYSPELIEMVTKEIVERSSPPEGSISPNELANELKVSRYMVARIASSLKEVFPQPLKLYFNIGKHGPPTLRYHKNFADAIREKILERKEKTGAETKEKELQQKLVEFTKEVSEGQELEAQEFKKLISLFGSSRAVDILFKFRPEFKGLPVQYVKSVIAEYIGDFLVVRHGFRGEDIPAGAEYLSESSLRDGLLEVMKESCLEYYHKSKKADNKKADELIIGEYILKIKQDTSQIINEDVASVIQDLESYYLSLLEIRKPERIIDEVRSNRQFPDLNQRINIKEISDKKKMLIADDMGLGKSASAILAKESLGVKQALVVAPSNVIETWRGYLHDYFKEGERPSVLIVDSIESLEEDLSGYEYILISHERINDEYTTQLISLNPGMLIVDEVHKFKNIREGIRSENLVRLADQIQGNDKYMAILSGTPVPNKIVDVALILKLLYPEKFQDLSSKEMAETIMKGDLIDLRALLIPRMQMKSLRDSVEMPQYIENPPTMIELSSLERDIYGVLLEEDELTATQKIQLLRQFLLNPEIIDATPGIHSSKSAELESSLNKDFKRVNKIVVFVNNYVEGVIRGSKSIIPKLQLPEDIEIRVIEGDVSKKDREEIERELNTSDKKILLLVSGQTADVGVDFSGGEMVYFYNDPWTEYDKAQQLARVYRPGLKHDLESKTFIASNTIEEGIHRFIAIKKRSIEKLLKGVPLTELDKEILEKTEKMTEGGLEVNPELAQYYFNSWDRLMRIFGEVREIGEKEFMSYLDEHGKELTHGEEYAKAYFDLGDRSYQSNANRIAGTLLDEFIKEAGQNPDDIRILDMASGPEMLKRHSTDAISPKIVSIDVNPAHFTRTEGGKRTIGQITTLPFSGESFNYINLTFALHYSRFVPTRGQIERLEIFKEMNRVLEENGRVLIDLVHSVEMKDFDSFKKNIKLFGFEVVENYTGDIEESNRYKSKIITLKKTRNLPEDFSVSELVKEMDKGQLNGFKFADLKGKLKDSRRILTSFRLGEREFAIRFNSSDRKTYQEEQSIIEKGEGMKTEHGGIAGIPAEEIIDNLFVRYRPKDTYRLFKRLQVSEGGVVIK